MDLTQVLAHIGNNALGDCPEYFDQSAGRTRLFHGAGRVCKVFLRNGDADERADRESASLAILADSEIPVPELLDQGTFPDGERWILMSELAGVPATVLDWDGPDGLRFLQFQGRVAALIHAAAAPPSFGVWTTDPVQSLADSATRHSTVLAEQVAAVRPERVELGQRLRLAQGNWLSSLANTTPVVVHGDLTPGNLLLNSPGPDGTLVGLLDWETADASTPAAEFSRPALFSAAGLRAFIAGYGEVGEVAPEQVAYFLVDRVLQIFGTTGGRWNPQVDRTAEDMAQRLLAGEFPIIAAT